MEHTGQAAHAMPVHDTHTAQCAGKVCLSLSVVKEGFFRCRFHMGGEGKDRLHIPGVGRPL